MCKQHHVAVDCQRPLDHPLGAAPDLFDRLAVDDGSRSDRPLRLFQPDFLRRSSFIDAIIPFEQVIGHFSRLTIAGQPAGLARPAQRATEHQSKSPTGQRLPQRGSLALTGRCQGDIGPTCVPLGLAPFRFTVPDQPEFLAWLAHVFSAAGLLAAPFPFPDLT